MTLPDDGLLSGTFIVGPYAEAADARKWTPLVDHEMGGRYLNDPTQGLRVQEWRVEYYNQTVYLSNAMDPGRVALFAMSGIREVSLAFDSSMSPFVAYMKEVGGALKYESWFWWFDATIPGFTHVKLPDYSYYPKCCLDDKRPLADAVGIRSIVLGYMRNNNLYTRQQNDRFNAEVLQAVNLPMRLNKVGMNIHNRLQFQLQALPAQ